jgi:hypothetical protein
VEALLPGVRGHRHRHRRLRPGRDRGHRGLHRFKAEVVEFLCDAPDEELAEDYCKILDDLMVEYLITLNMVVPVKPSAAAASTSVAKAVAALQQHEYEQFSGLAMVTLARWRASSESDMVEELDKLPDLVPASLAPFVGQAPSSRHAAANSGKKRQGTDAPTPFSTKTARAYTANIDEEKTTCHASPRDLRHRQEDASERCAAVQQGEDRSRRHGCHCQDEDAGRPWQR